MTEAALNEGSGEGTVDYALLSADLNAEAARLRQTGVAVDGPRDGGRARPDGASGRLPCVVMAHGFSATKAMLPASWTAQSR